jgi:hypothetical protein
VIENFRSSMLRSALGLLVLSTVISTSRPAHADILFIDLNYSFREVNAAKEEAKHRKETLVVIPQIDQAERLDMRRRFEEIESIKRKMTDIEKLRSSLQDKAQKLAAGIFDQTPVKKIAKSKNKKPAPPPPPVKVVLGKQDPKLDKKIADLTTADVSLQKLLWAKAGVYDYLRKRRGDLDQNLVTSIKAALTDSDTRKVNVTSIIISGHNDGGMFFGEAGGIRDADLFSMISSHTSSMNASSFYGWGCYTTTKENARMAKESVPSLKVIVGFDNRSPSQSFSGDLQYLQYVMRKEAVAKAIATPAQAKKFIGAIPHKGAMTPALLLDTKAGILYATPTEITKFANLNNDCTPAVLSRAVELTKTYEKYRDSRGAGFEDVPKDLENGFLRKFYTTLRKYSHCAAFGSLKLSGVDPNLVIPLVLYHEVQTNFGTYYDRDWSDLRILMAKVPGAMDPPDLLSKNTRRLDLLNFNSSMWGVFQGHDRDKYLTRDDVLFLEKMLWRVDKLLVGFKCTPEKWIEPSIGTPVTPSPVCVN